MALGVIRTDFHFVRAARAFEQRVPLVPRFDHFSSAVYHEEAVAHFGLRNGRAFAKRSPDAVEAAPGGRRKFQLAAHRKKNAIWRFRKDAWLGTPDVAGLCPWLRPSDDRLVGAGFVLATFVRDLKRRDAAEEHNEERGREHNETSDQSFVHDHAFKNTANLAVHLVGHILL